DLVDAVGTIPVEIAGSGSVKPIACNPPELLPDSGKYALCPLGMAWQTAPGTIENVTGLPQSMNMMEVVHVSKADTNGSNPRSIFVGDKSPSFESGYAP